MTKMNLIAEAGKQEIVIKRVFDAPRELVFKKKGLPSPWIVLPSF